jgi:hypothetical protein
VRKRTKRRKEVRDKQKKERTRKEHGFLLNTTKDCLLPPLLTLASFYYL